VGKEFTVTVKFLLPTQPVVVLVPLTLYLVVTVGLTVIDVLFEPVLQV
jgi:hypothetical protein